MQKIRILSVLGTTLHSDVGAPDNCAANLEACPAIKSGRLVDATQFSQQVWLGRHLGSPQIDFDSDVYARIRIRISHESIMGLFT